MNAFFAFLTSAAIAVSFRGPLRAVPAAGLAGMLGWTTARALMRAGAPELLGVFAGALMIGLAGELMARRLREPTLLFVVPGLFPLVPGLMAYNGMLMLAAERYTEAAQLLTRTLFYAGALAAGLALPTALFRRSGLPGK